MAHIELNNELPGIKGMMAFRPETAGPLNGLAGVLLRDDDNTLSRRERELIATYDNDYTQFTYSLFTTKY